MVVGASLSRVLHEMQRPSFGTPSLDQKTVYTQVILIELEKLTSYTSYTSLQHTLQPWVQESHTC